jgi:hypothetical protein
VYTAFSRPTGAKLAATLSRVRCANVTVLTGTARDSTGTFTDAPGATRSSRVSPFRSANTNGNPRSTDFPRHTSTPGASMSSSALTNGVRSIAS